MKHLTLELALLAIVVGTIFGALKSMHDLNDGRVQNTVNAIVLKK